MTGTALEALEERTGLHLPQLTAARARTRDGLARRREILASVDTDEDVSVVFVGSWGRCEVTEESDNDFWILTLGDPPEARPTIAAVRDALAAAEGDFREPGKSGPFANPQRFGDFKGVLGTAEDTNDTLTLRMLLVLESIALVNGDLHASAREDLLGSYLEAPVKPHHPPRLFLNDVVRYWRTMCVDFAGKMRERNGQGWGLRNAKLRTTRKMLFASGLLPLLRCIELEADEVRPFVLDQFTRPPVDRVAEAFLHFDQVDAGRRVFQAYDDFLALLGDADRRATLSAIKDRPQADTSEAFQAAVAVGDQVQSGLLELLFSERLDAATRGFAIF